MFKVILGVLFFTIITLVVFLNLDPKVAQQSISQISSISGDMMTANIAGEIQKPGSYLIKKQSTLGDLMSLAGGATTNADSSAYHASLTLETGITYYIAPIHDPTDICGTTALVKVGINSANAESLMTLSNIGSSLASAIMDYRQQQGPFTYLEQVMQVSGIGQSTYTRIKNYITLT
jgi:competence protein ComEA